jgi:hypothetical protein
MEVERIWEPMRKLYAFDQVLLMRAFVPSAVMSYASSPTFALGGHFLSSRQKIPFAFNVGTAKIGENRLGEDLASFLRHRSLACCC